MALRDVPRADSSPVPVDAAALRAELDALRSAVKQIEQEMRVELNQCYAEFGVSVRATHKWADTLAVIVTPSKEPENE